MIKPPPIQEPWKLDSFGRLVSHAWVLWLQEFSNSSNIDDLFVDTSSSQSTVSISSTHTGGSSNDSDVLIWMSF